MPGCVLALHAFPFMPTYEWRVNTWHVPPRAANTEKRNNVFAVATKDALELDSRDELGLHEKRWMRV